MDHKKSGRDRWKTKVHVVTRFQRIDELVEAAFAATDTDSSSEAETRGGEFIATCQTMTNRLGIRCSPYPKPLCFQVGRVAKTLLSSHLLISRPVRALAYARGSVPGSGRSLLQSARTRARRTPMSEGWNGSEARSAARHTCTLPSIPVPRITRREPSDGPVGSVTAPPG